VGSSNEDRAIVNCLIPTENVVVLTALYASGLPHALLACLDDAEYLENTLMRLEPAECLMLCRAMVVASKGCDTPMALETLMGLVRSHTNSKVRAHAAALVFEALQLGHVDDYEWANQSLPALLVAPYLASAIAFVVNDAGVDAQCFEQQCFTEQVLLGVLRIYAGPDVNSLSQLVVQMIDQLIGQPHISVALAGNTILYAIRVVGDDVRVTKHIVRKLLWPVIQRADAEDQFLDYAAENGFVDLEDNWIHE
jgi:hypothetical protein